MSKNPKIESTEEAWESGELGRDEKYARVSKSVDEKAIDEGLGLIPVTIRLQQSLVEDIKFIAELNGIRYQPLMRQVLTRFANCELKRITRDLMEEQDLRPSRDNNDHMDQAPEERKRA